MDDTFEKQRRNLLTTSILLLLIQFANVTISNDIKTSLLSIKIGQPEVILYFLYGIHLYLLTRFLNNRPVKSYTLSTLFYHKRMLYLANTILDDVLECIKSHKELDKQMEQIQAESNGMYDSTEDEYYKQLSPAIKNQTKSILSKKKDTLQLIEKTANEIERYERNSYRWQYQEGRYTEELSIIILFSKFTVYKSYIVGAYTTLFSEHFSKYQLPLFISVPPVILFAYYIFQMSK